MSKTFTSRPSQVSQRGRGRGNGRDNSQSRPQPAVRVGENINTRRSATVSKSDRKSDTDRSSSNSLARGVGVAGARRGKTVKTSVSNVSRRKMSSESPDNPNDRSGQEQQQTYSSSGYTVISPNEKKRQQVMQQAQREEEAYLAYQRHRPKQSYQTAGADSRVGGTSTEEEVRHRQMQTLRNAKLTNLDKQRKWKEEAKRKEDEAINQKLSQARAQTLQNEDRRRLKAATNSQKWDEDRRRKNDVFLSRLESQAQKVLPEQDAAERVSPKEVKGAGNTCVDIKRRGRMDARVNRDMLDRNETESYQPQREMLCGDGVRTETDTESHETASEPGPLEGKSSQQMHVILTLQDMFPAYQLDNLTEIAELSDYSLESAAALLTD